MYSQSTKTREEKNMAYFKASATQYISWVQRGLNRELGSNLMDNGVIGDTYRDLVWELNESRIGMHTSQVTRETQDLLVEVSNARHDYMSWVQLSLNAAGFFKGAMTGLIDPPTRDALLKFQGDKGLRDDAWVGPDTETWLITASGRRPPGQYTPLPPKPKPTPLPKPPVDFLDTARRVELWARTYRNDLIGDATVDPQRKARMRCVLGKVKSRWVADVNDRYMTASAVRAYLRAPLSKTESFPAELNRYTDSLKSKLEDYAAKCPGSRASAEAYQGFQAAFQKRFDEVELGLSTIQAYYGGSISDAMVHATGFKAKFLHRWAEDKVANSSDVYACFR